jgi:hypothetical protein
MLTAKLARTRGEIAKVCPTSLRGANGSRECAPDDRLRDEAIHSFFARRNGLLRYARNDEKSKLIPLACRD